MPLLKSRYKFTKVYRPANTRYAEARHENMYTALTRAFEAFQAEFGSEPCQEDTYVEMMGVTAMWVVTIFEIKDGE